MFFFCKALQGRMCVFELGDEAKQKLQKVELKCYDDSVARRYAIFLCSLDLEVDDNLVGQLLVKLIA